MHRHKYLTHLTHLTERHTMNENTHNNPNDDSHVHDAQEYYQNNANNTSSGDPEVQINIPPINFSKEDAIDAVDATAATYEQLAQEDTPVLPNLEDIIHTREETQRVKYKCATTLVVTVLLMLTTIILSAMMTCNNG